MRTILLLAIALIGPAIPAEADIKTIPVVCLTAEIEIKATPAAVWTQLTDGKHLITWCPVWKNGKNAAVRLTKVGDSLDFTDQWGNGGRSIVTFFAPGRELRVAHEPDNGSYLCQARVSLSLGGAGTRLSWVERYTDESSETDRTATATRMTADMKTTVATLKAQAEALHREGGR